MNSLFSCQIASAGFFAVIFFADTVKKHLPNRRTIFFQLFLCFMMLSSVFATAADLAGEYGEPGFILDMIQGIFLFLQMITCLMLHCYILSVDYQLHFRLSIDSVASLRAVGGCLYLVVASVLLLSSPWTHLCFYGDGGGGIVRTPVFWGLNLILLGMFVYDIGVVWLRCLKYSRRKRMMCLFLIIDFFAMLVAELFQMPGISFFKVATLFFAYMFYLSLQSPDFFVDNATGTFNRNGFFEIFQERLAYGKETSCLIIRVRNYQAMNQIYGGEVLRKVQRRIANALVGECGEKGVFHIGSSTFAIISKSREGTLALYDKLKEVLPQNWVLKNQVVNQEYSFYEITYPLDGEDFEELVQRIHYARSDHESTHKSGELVRLRSDEMEKSDEKREVASLVEEAIMDDSIELHFQPIFSFAKGRITSLEVLARLKDRNRKYINPEFFIHVAEENHTIIQLGEQIFRKACIFASYNHIFDYGIEDININLSPAQCRYEHLTEDFVRIADQYGIPMEKMHLEITESEFTDKDAVSRTLARLKETGAKVALDDFGTGNSTLSNILELPVDFVKIDKSLVWSFAEGKNQFLNELMPMIKAEGKKIIAEGIESADHIDIIKKLQGDYLQGYYYSRPLPEKEFLRFLLKFNKKVKEGEEKVVMDQKKAFG
ncbi:MAG: EAL domain-containing protein [Lachnospiraceae bacterium]|nr:EAL domain-containing protein [Lachnospiraceae bacterium]